MTQQLHSLVSDERTQYHPPQILAQVMFISALFTIARKRKQPKCTSTDECIMKTWYIYTGEYYSALRKNEIIIFIDKWMEIEKNYITDLERQMSHLLSYLLFPAPNL